MNTNGNSEQVGSCNNADNKTNLSECNFKKLSISENHVNHNNNNNNNGLDFVVDTDLPSQYGNRLSDYKRLCSDPIHKELVILNGRINEMDRNCLITNLKRLNLNTYGNVIALKKRLKNHYRLQKLSPDCLQTVCKLYPFYVVVDFEATCNEVNPPEYPHEIIEFPAVLVDSKKQVIVDEFHYYVKPKINQKLSEFCINLTGITQDVVDNADDFVVVLEKFEKWLSKHKLDSKNKYAFVTDGPWDMSRFLFLQCKISQIKFPNYAKKWVNIRRLFSTFYRMQKMRLDCMLAELGIEFLGRQHSGIDDSRNITTLLLQMMKDGVSLELNENIGTFKNYHNYYKKKIQFMQKRHESRTDAQFFVVPQQFTTCN